MKRSMFILFAAVVLANTTASADGRDGSMQSSTVQSLVGVQTQINYSNNSRWHDKGFGGWRTSGPWGQPVMADKGFAIYNVGFDICRLSCEVNGSCKGIEYISTPWGGWFEDSLGYHVTNKCEIHYDQFAHCDTNGGGNGTWDGCWVKK